MSAYRCPTCSGYHLRSLRAPTAKPLTVGDELVDRRDGGSRWVVADVSSPPDGGVVRFTLAALPDLRSRRELTFAEVRAQYRPR